MEKLNILIICGVCLIVYGAKKWFEFQQLKQEQEWVLERMRLEMQRMTRFHALQLEMLRFLNDLAQERKTEQAQQRDT